jgi:hypothetical protein
MPAGAGWLAAATPPPGRAAPDDALPMLADSAAALADVPAGALRVINYEPGQLTLDFEKSAGAAVASAGARLGCARAVGPAKRRRPTACAQG